jgi:hypothetical protein
LLLLALQLILIAMLAAYAFVLSLSVCRAQVTNTSVDIHLKLDSVTEDYVVSLGKTIHGIDANDDIDFTTDQPHITLYLTAFQTSQLPALKDAVQEVLQQSDFGRCQISMPNAGLIVSGSYGMWNTANPACLQRMSDSIVNATYKYAIPNQPIPSWVDGLPEPTKSEKIHMIQEYGSPNVFSQFQPHVTLAFDGSPSNASNLSTAFAVLKKTVNDTSTIPTVVGLGTVGAHGTVLRGKDMAQFPF